MGASFIAARASGTKEEVRKEFQEWQENDRYENGHSYSGGWGQARGLEFEEKLSFPTVEHAEEWLVDNTEKWGPAVAVRVPTKTELPKSAEALVVRRRELEEQIFRYPNEVLKRVRAGASQFKTCSACGSKIAVKHVGYINCPVCRAEFLLTETDRKKLEALKAKVKELSGKVQAAYAKAAEGKPQDWYIGGWMSS